ncbi:hypothetical protein HETIRDRAFT_426227 [Heterobasidion irregulare TC 32-1]|uniref:Uncharacterized protein n=1 Tax=Heterobasidion irregulare (strain TC 32-1) TaxID=747525 RepID=W4KA44_HETIT|nr:uncharacterized protein HETIRDRAFT_426227 [Heterobasidion irregulare TC 32-1]ETW82619.1 hypothetical protein HETIRDRAFT_426227 [Heterobasidion irregulare TC 32-1]
MRAINKDICHFLTPRIFRQVRFRDTWKSAAAFEELPLCQDPAQHMKEISFQSIDADDEGEEVYIAELQPDGDSFEDMPQERDRPLTAVEEQSHSAFSNLNMLPNLKSLALTFDPNLEYIPNLRRQTIIFEAIAHQYLRSLESIIINNFMAVFAPVYKSPSFLALFNSVSHLRLMILPQTDGAVDNRTDFWLQIIQRQILKPRASLPQSLVSLTFHGQAFDSADPVGFDSSFSFRSLKFSFLTFLSLKYFLFGEKASDGVDFIIRHKETLRTLELKSCIILLPSAGPRRFWSRVWTCFSKELQALTSLHVEEEKNHVRYGIDDGVLFEPFTYGEEFEDLIELPDQKEDDRALHFFLKLLPQTLYFDVIVDSRSSTVQKYIREHRKIQRDISMPKSGAICKGSPFSNSGYILGWVPLMNSDRKMGLFEPITAMETQLALAFLDIDTFQNLRALFIVFPPVEDDYLSNLRRQLFVFSVLYGVELHSLKLLTINNYIVLLAQHYWDLDFYCLFNSLSHLHPSVLPQCDDGLEHYGDFWVDAVQLRILRHVSLSRCLASLSLRSVSNNYDDPMGSQSRLVLKTLAASFYTLDSWTQFVPTFVTFHGTATLLVGHLELLCRGTESIDVPVWQPAMKTLVHKLGDVARRRDHSDALVDHMVRARGEVEHVVGGGAAAAPDTDEGGEVVRGDVHVDEAERDGEHFAHVAED